MKDDSQLVDEALRGESASFGFLVQRHQDRLYNTIVHVVGCREAAKDVVQDAFVQAFVKLDSFRQDSAFYTWLYRIAFNVAISHRRKRKNELSIDLNRELSGCDPLDQGESPEERLVREERAVELRAALDELSEDHRAILVLREMEGCCYESISEVLDLPIGTVRSRLHRARSQLREQLECRRQKNPAS